MTQDRSNEPSHRNAGTAGPDSACPETGRLAEYVDGVLPAPDREVIEQHLADCADCREIVGTALRAGAPTAHEPVPELWLARARRLAAKRRPRRMPTWAAAASVVLALGLTVLLRAPEPPGTTPIDWETTRGSRLLPERASVPEIIAPLDHDQISRSDLVVSWKPVDGATAYGVRIVDEDGDVVEERRTNGTEWKPDEALLLTTNARYFVRVDAYTSDGRPLSSTHVPFSVTD